MPDDTRVGVGGQAATQGQLLPLGSDDPVIAARAVRRALAEARRRASDVSTLVVACSSPITQNVLVGFARRALGPHGSHVRVACVMSDAADAKGLAEAAASALGGLLMAEDDPGIGIAMGLGADGGIEARCLSFGRWPDTRRPGRGPGPAARIPG